MISYKDMTFCDSPCGNIGCPRRLTAKVISDAEKWWGSGQAPISVASFRDVCKLYVEENTNEQKIT